MDKELVIQSSETGIEIALLENKKIVELHYDNSGGSFNVGDLYLGKIKKIMPGLNAAFVDIGHEKDAFFTTPILVLNSRAYSSSPNWLWPITGANRFTSPIFPSKTI